MEEWLMEKRFTTNGYYIYDHFKGNEWLVNEVEAEEIVEIMNNLDMKTRERSKALSKLQKENEQLKQREQTLTAKIDRILHQRDGNEKQHLKVMSYLHDNYYSIWEECLKELGD